MGSGEHEHVKKTGPLGSFLATHGVHLLTGGGGGVMASVSRAFVSVPGKQGLSIGVLPASVGESDRQQYPNRWIEVPIKTHLPARGQSGSDPQSRNHINILTADLIVALPGSAGTASEVQLAVTYGRPIVAFVDSVLDIPGLDRFPGIPVANDLLTVQQFLMEHLDRFRV